MAARLKVQPDGKPRIMFMRDAVVKRDPALVDRVKPTCTVEEFPSYIWDISNNRKRGEEPVKEYDHGMDATRYKVAATDLARRSFGAAPL